MITTKQSKMNFLDFIQFYFLFLKLKLKCNKKSKRNKITYNGLLRNNVKLKFEQLGYKIDVYTWTVYVWSDIILKD